MLGRFSVRSVCVLVLLPFFPFEEKKNEEDNKRSNSKPEFETNIH